MKLLQIYNGLAHYREGIYSQIDREYESNYLIVKAKSDIKQIDPAIFRGKVKMVEGKSWHGLLFQPGLMKAMRQPYDVYLALGETRNVSLWLFALMLRLFYPKKRVYFWSHGWYGKESGKEKLLKKLFFRLPKGGTFLYGNYARELMIKEGFKPETLFVIHNSLAYDKQLAIRKQLHVSAIYQEHFGNSLPNLMFVGRLTKVKHLDLVLRAMHLLNQKGHQYNFTLIGGGQEMESLQALSKELQLDKQVWFYGPCYDEQELGNLIYNADLCVSPGNVGLTAMHVMVFGTPVITHNDFPWQMPEFEAIHDGETGTFFERGSIESLADGIQKWLDTKAGKREEVRQACFHEIDTQWTPQFQLDVIKKHLR